jgi:hypothetical protein
MKRIAVLFVLSVLTGSAVSAQTSQTAALDLRGTLTPGKTVWITDAAGREEKTQVLTVSGDSITTSTGSDIRHVQTADVKRITARQSDSVLNGALIGAGVGLASGLFLCRLTEPWEVCNNPGPLLRIGALGAGIGIGIDALIRGRKTVYVAPDSARLHAAPIVGRRAGGLQLSLSF